MVSEKTESGELALRLMAQVAAGNTHAQTRLAARLAARVHRVCHLIVRHRAAGDDATQIALMEILRSAGSYQVDLGIEAWADRIAVRTALRAARKERRLFSFLRTGEDPEALAGSDPLLRLHLTGWTSAALKTCLDRLPEARRQAFVLKHALGYTVEEIAALTDAPPGTVKDRLVAARKQLRKMMMARGGVP